MNTAERINQLETIIEGLANAASKDEKKAHRKFTLQKLLILCLCIAFCVGNVCGIIIGVYAIKRNYEYLESLVIETEVYEYDFEADSEGKGNASIIYGDSNNIIGGDVVGES